MSRLDRTRLAFSTYFHAFNNFVASLSVRWTDTGMCNTSRKATTSKQPDMFFEEKDFFIWGNIPLFPRLFLATVNNL